MICSYSAGGGIHVKIWEAKRDPRWRPGCDQGYGRQKVGRTEELV